jgi:3'(2'), 5'-bisphosphate nucleotidase
VWNVVRETLDESAALDVELGGIKDEEEMMALIDKGTHEGGGVGSL